MEQDLTTMNISEIYRDPVTHHADLKLARCPDSATETSKSIISFLLLYFTPVLLFFGSFGNVLCFVIFSRPPLRNSAPAFYFRVLAVADTLALNVALWPNWIKDAFDRPIYPFTDITCRIQTYLKYVFADFAVWILVIMTIERTVAVCRPHLVRGIFTGVVIYVSILTMILAITVINIPSIFINISNNNSIYPACVTPNIDLGYKIWPWIDMTIYCLVPSTIIITCNSMMIYTIIRRQKNTSRRTHTGSETDYTMTAMTANLITVTVVFVLLTAPFALYSCSTFYFHRDQRVDWCLAYFITRFLRYVNNSVNFPLYCMSGRSFRVELNKLFQKTTGPRTDLMEQWFRRYLFVY